jgi:SpoVK/Ycf46/Vps4 family AAA+-type ATPase
MTTPAVSTQVVPTVSSQIVPMGSTTDTHQYMNLMMSNMIFKQMSSILNSNTKLTASNIVKLLAIMSLDEIRKVFMDAIKNIFNYIKENYGKVFEWINQNIFHNYFIEGIIKIFKKIIGKPPKKEIPSEYFEYEIPKTTCVNISMKLNVEFFDSLIKYIKNNRQCSFNISNNKEVELVDLKNTVIKETWSNIKIMYQDVEIYINNSLNLEFINSKNSMKLKKMDCRIYTIDITKEYDSIIDLIPDTEVQALLTKAYLYNCEEKLKNIHSDEPTIKSHIHKMCPETHFLLNYKFKNLEKTLYIYYLLLSKNFFKTGQKIISYITSKTSNTTDAQLKYQNYILHGVLYNYVNKSLDTEFYVEKLEKTEFVKTLLNTEDPTPKNPTALNIQIIGDITKTKDELYKIFNDYTTEISSYVEPSTKNQKIKINIIKVKKTQIVSSKPNPEYIQYEEQRANIKELASKDKDDITIKEFLLRTPPNKTIETVEIKKEVEIEQINEIYKSLDTLYLRQQDQEKLKKVLYSFLHQMELYEELGLPNKLNVFLSGLPGTGKTSIIQVIASYLQKNIYYCNINDKMTNDEVQMIFDYVIKNSIGGGIIVTEDVDAMTRIVHKRIKDSSSVSSSVSSSISSSKSSTSIDTELLEPTTMEIYETKDNSLTLEYLLNLLQGSLTQDGTIFIATTNHKELIDPAFYRDGRFDVKIDMKLCDKYQINCIYKKFMNREIPEKVINRIQEDTFTPANIIFRVKDYICSDLSDEAILEPFIN